MDQYHAHKLFQDECTFINARSEIFPWFPHPTIVTVRASGLAKYFAATPVAAPVRIVVISIESISANNFPFEASLIAMTP